MNHWTEVYRSDSTLQAQLKKRLLEQYGLKPVLLGDNLASLVGMGGASSFVPWELGWWFAHPPLAGWLASWLAGRKAGRLPDWLAD